MIVYMVLRRAIANSLKRFPPAEIIFEWRAMHTKGARPRPSSTFWGRAARSSFPDVLLHPVLSLKRISQTSNVKRISLGQKHELFSLSGSFCFGTKNTICKNTFFCFVLFSLVSGGGGQLTGGPNRNVTMSVLRCRTMRQHSHDIPTNDILKENKLHLQYERQSLIRKQPMSICGWIKSSDECCWKRKSNYIEQD